jgi:hypothetical protein
VASGEAVGDQRTGELADMISIEETPMEEI